jgi:hypothetical protein
MKTRITEKQLKRFYRLMSVPMTDFDCGRICAPKNEGIPFCCENEFVTPLLFHEEFRWHRRKDRFWKRAPMDNKEIKKMVDESASYYVYSFCPGPGKCRRTRRAIVCRTFPFEPQVDKEGRVLGLVYINSGTENCSLIGKPKKIYNPQYISNSIKFWQELLDTYPPEKKLYIDESRKRERRLKRQGKKLRIFR